MLVATAVRTCWRCVFCLPIYRARRRPVLRVVCEKVAQSPSSHTIEPLKICRLLAQTGCLQQLMAFSWRAHRHAPSAAARIGTTLAHWTGLAGTLGKQNLHDRFAFGILAEIPGTPLLPLRTGGPLVLPVEVKLRDISGAWCPGLPARVAVDWSNQTSGVDIPAVQDALGTDIACVYQVLGRQHLFCGQVCLNGLQRMLVLLNGRRRFEPL
jgi:hypothetical protein